MISFISSFVSDFSSWFRFIIFYSLNMVSLVNHIFCYNFVFCVFIWFCVDLLASVTNCLRSDSCFYTFSFNRTYKYSVIISILLHSFFYYCLIVSMVDCLFFYSLLQLYLALLSIRFLSRPFYIYMAEKFLLMLMLLSFIMLTVYRTYF